MNHLTNAQLIEIAIAFGGAIIIGWLIKKFLFPVFYRMASKTKWKSDDLVIGIICRWVIFLFVLSACRYTVPILAEAFVFVKKNEATLNNIIAALFIFAFTSMAAKIAAGLLVIRSASDNSILPTTSILGNIAKAMLYVIGFILVLQTFGVAIAPLVTALGVGGIAVALALQPTLSNLFSGLQIIASGKINIGDLVQLENAQKGIVTDITWRNTVIKTAQNNLIIMPNSKMSDSVIENFFLNDREVTFNIEVGVGYESDLEKVEQVSIEVAKEILATHEGGVKNFDPFVRFYNFGDSSINLRIFLRAKEFGEQFLITSSFIKALQQRYQQEGINIPFPIRTVLLKQDQPAADSSRQ
jgi:small-conductance mechanosensitive channel